LLAPCRHKARAAMDWSLDVINAYCKEHFPNDVACELVEGKGRIMIAQRDVQQGDVLFVEPPLHIVAEDPHNDAFVAVRQLCMCNPDDFDYEPLWYWTALCSLTKEQVKAGPRMGSLPTVSLEQQRRLLCLYHEPVDRVSVAVTRIVKVLGLKVAPLAVEELLQAWILNCFEHSDDPPGYSAYFASSFANHSCSPNAIWAEGDDGAHVVRAREPVAKGDEVTISYLEEQVLLQSADARKKVLRDTKLFECTCPRCAAKTADEGESIGVDMCRGYICKACGECQVFHPLKRMGKGKGKGKTKGTALVGVSCAACGAAADCNESERLLSAETQLQAKLDKLDEQVAERGYKVMEQDRVQSLLKLVANGKAGPVGPQHWLADRLWEHLQEWYDQEGRREDARQMLRLRAAYQRRAYPGLSAALAWTLEKQADVFMRHLGFGAKMLDSDAPLEEELVEEVGPIFEESMRILGLMFGKDHEHFVQVERKHRMALAFFQKRAQVCR